MVVLPPQGASDTYGQLPHTGADTIRAPRHGFARLLPPFHGKRNTGRTMTRRANMNGSWLPMTGVSATGISTGQLNQLQGVPDISH